MTFRRLTVPAYSGGLPAGYGYANNAVSGVPALIDPAASDGPNLGTFLVGFGEPARGAVVNRGLAAALTNTDYLDNLLRADIAMPTRTADATAPGGGVNNVVFGAGTFVGVGGTPNTTAGINTFVDILDTNDNEIIIPSSGARCMVTSITGAVPGDGFSTGSVTFNISPAIPSGQAYRIYYSVRSNLATLPVDAFTNIKIRGAQELPAAFEDFQKMISRYSGNNVAALVGSAFETPDGVRLAKQASITFDSDIDASVGSASVSRGFTFRVRKNSTPVTLGQLREVLSTEGPYDAGVRYALYRGTTTAVDWFAGSGALTDSNILGAYLSNVNNSGPVFPYTGGTGATIPRIMEMPSQFDSGSNPMGYGAAQSLLSMLNARPFVTCGDGVQSFGDFNGAAAVEEAIAFYASNGGTYVSNFGITVYVKPGNYTLSQTSVALAAFQGEYRIIGASREACILTVISADGSSFGCAAGATLTLENLTIKNDGVHTNGSLKISGLLRTKNVTLSRHNVVLTNPVNTNRAGAPCCIMESTKIDLGSFSLADGRACIELDVGDAGTHSDFLFQDCTFMSMTSSPVMRIKATSAGISATTVRRVHFRDCNLTLLSTTDDGAGTLVGNPGVMETDANGSSALLTIDDVLYDHCRVTANSGGTGTNAILAHIHPLPRGSGATPASGSVKLGTVSIVGGTWTATSGATGTVISPLFIASSNVVVADATFVGTGLKNGMPPIESRYLINGVAGAAIASADWNAFVFAPGGLGMLNLLGANPTLPSLCIRNAAFVNFGRLTDSGDLGLWVPENGVISGIQLSGYVAAGAGAVPNQRVTVAAQHSATPGTKALIEGIHVTGVDAGGGNDFTATATNQQGIIFLRSQGNLHLKRCTIRNFLRGGGPSFSVGFALWIPLTTDTPTPQATAAYGLTLEDCEADSLGNGVAISVASSSAVVVGQTRIVRGRYTNNSSNGILFSPYVFDQLSITDAEIAYNGSYGVQVTPSQWTGSATLLGNRVHDNAGLATATQIYIFGTTSQLPQGHCSHNNCMGDAGVGGSPTSYGGIEYYQNNTNIQGFVDYDFAGGSGGAIVKMRGIETTAYVGAVSPTAQVGRNYVRNTIMVHNQAKLITT